MTHDRTAALLEDLARLLRKHGPETFEALAELLGSPRFPETISKLLKTTAREGHARGIRRKDPDERTPTRSPAFATIQSSDPERNCVLSQIQTKLLSGRTFPRILDLQNLAESIRAPVKPSQRRTQVIDAIVLSLLNRPLDELSNILKRIDAPEPVSSLRGWSDIILPKQ